MGRETEREDETWRGGEREGVEGGKEREGGGRDIEGESRRGGI
jgi:hypothetical protein